MRKGAGLDTGASRYAKPAPLPPPETKGKQMSVILTQVGTSRRTAKAYFGPESDPGEPLTFTYDPSKYTPVLEGEVFGAADKGMFATMYANRLENVLLDWDAMQVDPDDQAKVDAGELVPSAAKLVPFPPTHDNIFKTPLEALRKIVIAMNEDQRPSPEVSGNSSGSFGTGEK